MTPEQKQKILKVCKKFHFDFAVLFGSSSQKSQFARDHDIAFYSRKKTASELSLKLSSDLYPFFTKPVDIIILTSTTDPLLSYEIAHKGELICELKKESFLQFQTMSWKKYIDTKRYREYEKEYIRKKVKNVA